MVATYLAGSDDITERVKFVSMWIKATINMYPSVKEFVVTVEDQYFDGLNVVVFASIRGNALLWENAFRVCQMIMPNAHKLTIRDKVLSRTWHTALGIKQENRHVQSEIGLNARNYVEEKFGSKYAIEDIAQALCIAYASSIGVLLERQEETKLIKKEKKKRDKRKIKKIK